MRLILRALFFGDALLDRLEEWLTTLNRAEIEGIPQGSSLSPILSVLYLQSIDADCSRLLSSRPRYRMNDGPGLYLRYGDDILILATEADRAERAKKAAERFLRLLGLSLNEKKFRIIDAPQAFPFLGYSISSTGMPIRLEQTESEWSVFRSDPFIDGISLYLSPTMGRIKVDGQRLSVLTKHVQDNIPSSGEAQPIANDEISQSYPWKIIARIFLLSNISYPSALLTVAMRKMIPVAFLDYRGELNGLLLPEGSVDSSFQAKQVVAFADQNFSLAAAKILVTAKLCNSLAMIDRWECSDESLEARAVQKTLLAGLQASALATDLDELRGYEGSSARAYFGFFARHVAPFTFQSRVYRPPEGEINALLSFGYTLMYQRMAAALKCNGFLPFVGFYHQQHGLHMTLASDLMEPFRFFVDDLVIRSVSGGIIKPSDFKPGYVETTRYLVWEARTRFIEFFEREFMDVKFQFPTHEPRSVSWGIDESIRLLLAAIRLGIPLRMVHL